MAAGGGGGGWQRARVPSAPTASGRPAGRGGHRRQGRRGEVHGERGGGGSVRGAAEGGGRGGGCVRGRRPSRPPPRCRDGSHQGSRRPASSPPPPTHPAPAPPASPTPVVILTALLLVPCLSSFCQSPTDRVTAAAAAARRLLVGPQTRAPSGAPCPPLRSRHPSRRPPARPPAAPRGVRATATWKGGRRRRGGVPPAGPLSRLPGIRRGWQEEGGAPARRTHPACLVVLPTPPNSSRVLFPFSPVVLPKRLAVASSSPVFLLPRPPPVFLPPTFEPTPSRQGVAVAFPSPPCSAPQPHPIPPHAHYGRGLCSKRPLLLCPSAQCLAESRQGAQKPNCEQNVSRRSGGDNSRLTPPLLWCHARLLPRRGKGGVWGGGGGGGEDQTPPPCTERRLQWVAPRGAVASPSAPPPFTAGGCRSREGNRRNRRGDRQQEANGTEGGAARRYRPLPLPRGKRPTEKKNGNRCNERLPPSVVAQTPGGEMANKAPLL